jgi:WD40 repeat protein
VGAPTSISYARIEIEEALTGTTPAAPNLPASISNVKKNRLWVALASLAVLFAAAFTGLLGLYLTRIEPREIRVQINTPSTQDPTSFAISPDGQRMVFVANNDGKPPTRGIHAKAV